MRSSWSETVTGKGLLAKPSASAEVLRYERAWHSQLREEDLNGFIINGYYTEQGI